jgi:FKBP12-rapamycin complex-associated protein
VHLLRICYEYVVRFQDDYSAKIRSAAAATCIAVIDKATSAVEAETDLALLVPKIIDSLMMLGVGDDSVEIRIKVFSSLTPSVDAYIARSDCIHCLIDALNDESPPVRAAAVSVLTRAAHYDAVHIMPIVLLSLRELLNTLQTSIDHAVLHSSVKQLQSLVKGLGSYIVPYAKQVLKPLLDLLSNSSYEIAGEVLSTIGEVAIACPDLIRSEHLDELFPSLIQALQDSSSISKQETAVIALGACASNLLHVLY